MAPAVRGAPDASAVIYDLFGNLLELRAANPSIISTLARRESCWKPLLRSATTGEIAAVVEVIEHPPPSPLSEVQHFSNEHFFLHGSSSRLLTGYLYERPWQVHVQSYVADETTTIDNMVLPTLNNVLLRLGLVNVHAAAVARAGDGLMLIGPSGSGKSTTSLLLARSGFDFLSDNDIYVRRNGDGVDAFSSSNDVFLVEDTGERIDGLQFVDELPLRMRGATAKRILDMGTAMPGRCIDSARVRVLLFPRVGDAEATELTRMDEFSCLDRLLQLVPARGLPAAIKDRIAQANQFEILAALASSVEAYEVRLGRRAAGVVEALGGLV